MASSRDAGGGRTGGVARAGKRALVGASIALAVVLTLVGALELGARLLRDEPFVAGLPVGTPEEGCAVHDPDRGWRNKPGVRTRVVAPRFEYAVSINSRGLRDREHDHAKPPGVRRVALLGDSVAWGWGVDDGAGFADLLEDRLGPGVEVINLAVPGYSTDQHLATLTDEAARYDPDLVLLCFVLNDVLGNHTDEGYFTGKPVWRRDAAGDWRLENHPVPAPSGDAPRPSPAARLYANSALWQALQPPDAERQIEDAARALPPPSDEAKLRAYRKYKDGAARLAGELVDEDSVTFFLVRRIASWCDARGVPLVAFCVPHHHDRYLYQQGPHRPPEADRRPFRTDVSQRLAEAGERLGFATFSVDEAFLDHLADAGELHVGDGHPNEYAHRLITDELERALAPFVAAWEGDGR